jgi:hypothetical protein
MPTKEFPKRLRIVVDGKVLPSKIVLLEDNNTDQPKSETRSTSR